MSKKMLTVAAIYAAAAIVTLGIYSFVSYKNLNAYRYAAKYSSQRSVEESVTAVNALSGALAKSVYAVDGSMCGKICAESYADALAAQAAISTLPFSTQELERISGYLGVAGDYCYSLCSSASQDGFTKEQVRTLTGLSDTAAELAASLTELQGDLNDKLVTIDSSELRLENVGVEDTERLSARMLKYEENFPQQKELDYDGKFSATEETVTGSLSDTQKLAAAAEFAGVGLGDLKSEYEYRGEDGRRCFGTEGLEICVSSRGVESMSQCRLVSSGRIREEKAQETAARFLNAHGYDSVEMTSAVKSGETEQMEFARVEDGALCVDELLRISVALDDGSVYSFNAEDYSGGKIDVQWTVSEEQAAEKIPGALEAAEAKKVIIRTDGGELRPCWLFACADGERTVKIYVDGETGKQCRIEL